jgi:hypothetical protein
MPSSGRRASILEGRSDLVSASLSDVRVRDEVSVGLMPLERDELLDIPSVISTPNNSKKPIPTEIKSMSTPSVTGHNRRRLRCLHHVQEPGARPLFP